MADVQQLVRKAQVQGRITSPERGLRWLRASASILAQWGGAQARDVVERALPSDLLRGQGSKGLSLKAALEEAAGDAGTALNAEAGRRAGELDPAKVAWSLMGCLSVLREALSEDDLSTLVKSLPEDLRDRLGQAGWNPPWRYRLVPQPFGQGRRRQRELKTGSSFARR